MSERRPCPNLEANNQDCNCANTSCARHGVCCLCVQAHRDASHLPACLRHFEK